MTEETENYYLELWQGADARAKKLEAELATKTALLNDLANIVEELRQANEKGENLHAKYRETCAERDRLLAIMEKIATDYNCDPRIEAQNALGGYSYTMGTFKEGQP